MAPTQLQAWAIMEQGAGNLPGARVLFERGLAANPRNIPCLQVVFLFKWLFLGCLCVFLLGLVLGCLLGRLVLPHVPCILSDLNSKSDILDALVILFTGLCTYGTAKW